LRFYLIVLFLLFVLPQGVEGKQRESVGFRRFAIDGISINVVKIDLKNPSIKVRPVLPNKSKNESIYSMVKKTKPLAAINGTYFDKKTFKPVGDIMIDKKLINFGGLGTAMAITKTGNINFIDVIPHRHVDWADSYTHVVAAGPRLVTEGKITLFPYDQGFRDPWIYLHRNRSAIGLTKDKELLFVTISRGVLLRELAIIMVKLGAVEAMNLDGGSSSALYYKGNFITRPKGLMTNIIGVYYFK
jgi:exopolysaccharide biosynthesis protein